MRKKAQEHRKENKMAGIKYQRNLFKVQDLLNCWLNKLNLNDPKRQKKGLTDCSIKVRKRSL